MDTQFIENIMNGTLQIGVVAFQGLYEDEGENSKDAYSIYHKDEKNKSPEDYKQYSPDYEIYKLKDREYIFTICTQTFMGSYWQPPEWDYVESKVTYKTEKEALIGLIEELFKDRINDFLMAEEERRAYEYDKNIKL